MDDLLRDALADRAAAVTLSQGAWEENTRRIRRDTHRRTTIAGLAVVAASTVGVLGFSYLHEPGRGQPLPTQPLSTARPVPTSSR
ncbi:MAG: hypothetical protein M3P04_04145 [Actinomycetota bacterium]|nr:hypothetical protein [Actinomycetota bacterium]